MRFASELWEVGGLVGAWYITLCDKFCRRLATTGRWFSPGTSVSSTNKTDRHEITEILLKVALSIIKPTNQPTNFLFCFVCLFVCLFDGVYNATFNNISVISWRSVLLVEETGVPRENH
jgi:hypothetical protein